MRKVCTSSCLGGCLRAFTVRVPSAASDDVTEVGSTSSGSWHLCVKVFITEPSEASFSARTSIWLFDVVTMTSSGEKSRTSTVNWYESPRVLIFPDPLENPRASLPGPMKEPKSSANSPRLFSMYGLPEDEVDEDEEVDEVWWKLRSDR